MFGLPDAVPLPGPRPARSPRCSSTAVYLFRSGDVIADGNTISGPRDDDGRARLSFHERATGPSRQVIDVDLGEPYADRARTDRRLAASVGDGGGFSAMREQLKTLHQSSADRSTRHAEGSSTSGR
jgi:hypothetical protein